MMKLEELQEMWKKDCVINQTDLGTAAAETPKLHAKYLAFLTTYKLHLRKSEVEYFKLKKLKYQYFSGMLSKEQLSELGWEQFLLARPLKNEMDDYLNSDDDIIRLIDKIEYLKAIIFQLEQILKAINSRTWDIKAAIDWYRWTSGN